MFSRLLFSVLFAVMSFSAFSQANVSTNKQTSRYEVGEQISFIVTSNSSSNVTYSIYYDKFAPIETGSVFVQAGVPTTINYTANEPTTITCSVNQFGAISTSTAAVSPFDIQPLESEPGDFDSFWATQRAELASIPINPNITIHTSTVYTTTYRLNLGHVDNRRVYGYLTVPKGSGNYPAIVFMPAFGQGANFTRPETTFGEQSNTISLAISIHNAELNQNDPNSYSPDNFSIPEQNYYRQAVLAGIRAIDYLYTRPDVDQSKIGIYGNSQGGGLAMLVAGIDNRVKVCMNTISTFSQHSGFKYGRSSGFPYFLNNALGFMYPQEQTLAAVKYYDAMYAAARFQGTVLMNISYLDSTSPAAPIFAAYNQFTGNNKILIHSTRLEHVSPSIMWEARYKLLRNVWPSATANPLLPFGDTTSKGHWANAGSNKTGQVNAPVGLNGTVTYNEVPNNSWPVTWEKVSGPGNVNIANPNSRNTSATFSSNGTYILRLRAEDRTTAASLNHFITIEDFVQVTIGGTNNNQQNQTITFNSISDKLTTDNNFNVSASASSGLPVTLSIASGPATISGNTISLNGIEGTVVVRASQIGSTSYFPAPQVNRTFQVIAAPTGGGGGDDDGNGNGGGGNGGGGNTNCTDSDNDGTCDAEDCAIWNPNIPAAPGTPCNDYNPHNFNDVYLADGCTCQGSGNALEGDTGPDTSGGSGGGGGGNTNCTDSDNDGTCDAEDCAIWNPNIPATPGTPCNDYDPHNFNDVYLADGCTCRGSGNALEGDTGPSEGGSGGGGGNTNCSDLDNDGTCDEDDCAVWNPNIPATPGTPCNDYDPHNFNDVYLADGCTCQGSGNALSGGITGSGGGSSSANGDCNNPSLISQGKTTTQSSTLNVNGVSGSAFKAVDGNTAGTYWSGSVSATTESFQPWLQVDLGASYNITEIKVWNRTEGASRLDNFQVMISDTPFSGTLNNAVNGSSWNSQTSGEAGRPTNYNVNNTGRYIRIQANGTSFLTIAEVQVYGCSNNSGGSNTSDNTSNESPNPNCSDSDNDGTCDAEDCAIWNPNIPATPGTPCNDYDPHNFNDVYLADGCTCQGSGNALDNCTDSDSDGTCDAEDCAIWNPNIPATPGTPCNDYNPHNFNDVYLGDGCTCQGSGNALAGDTGGSSNTNTNTNATSINTNSGINYCNTRGNNTTYEYIERVTIGSMQNLSGNNAGYGDFENLSASGRVHENLFLNLVPGFSGSADRVYWRVWIDYNHDGDFTDYGEDFYERSSNRSIFANVEIPNFVASGPTTIRVAMKSGSYPDPCEDFAFGEVEDYTINLAQANSPIQSFAEIDEEKFDFVLRPNPVNDFIISDFSNKESEKNIHSIFLYNTFGSKIALDKLKHRIEEDRLIIYTSDLQPGYYLLSIGYEKSFITKPFVKIK